MEKDDQEIFKQPLCLNPITGRRVWLLRHIPTGRFGDTPDWVTNATRKWWWSREAEMSGLCGIMGRDFKKTKAALKDLQRYLHDDMGFKDVWALRKGRWVKY